MSGKRLLFAAVLVILMTSTGCTRYWCEHHGYYPSGPAACAPCCVPCCPTAPSGYAAPAPSWNAPVAAAPAAGGCCCVPAAAPYH